MLKLGDKVYYIASNNTVAVGVLIEIKNFINVNNGVINLDVRTLYMVKISNNYNLEFSESQLFKTKNDAINYLIEKLEKQKES